MDGPVDVLDGDPEVVICLDEFGPLNLQPHPGRQWTSRAGGGPRPRRRRRATYTRPHGVRHLLAAYDLSRDRLYGHVKARKRRGEFLVFLRYVRSLYAPALRYVALDGTDHASHAEQAGMIRRYIAWRNRNTRDVASAKSSQHKRRLTRH